LGKLDASIFRAKVKAGNSFEKSVTLYQATRRYTGRFIMFSMSTNIYNKKTKGPTLMERFTATGKLNKFIFDN
jgi:hypothetical protein